ncbi:MAG: hypothetical protein R3E86_01325 [Pseudomonadales bacterium]
MSNFQVLFSGEVSRGADTDVVRTSVAHELGIDDRKSRQLFTGRTVVIKSQLTQAEALALQERLGALGAVCRIKDLDAPGASHAGPAIDKDALRMESHVQDTLKDITAAHIECPRCGHLQLESSHCTRCGVDIAAAVAQKRKEDLLIEKKLRELRGARPGTEAVRSPAAPAGSGGRVAAAGAPPAAPSVAARRPKPDATRMRPPEPAPAPADEPGRRSGFVRGLFKRSS